MMRLKKRLTLMLALCVLFLTPSTSWADYDLESIISNTAAYICKSVGNPQVGSIGGEWAVFGLARSGADIPEEYYRNYYKNAEQYVKDCGGVLSDKKYTEYSRLIIALTAIGKNPADVAGYNLLMPLGDYEKTVWQGINGPVWALLALDCGNYDIPKNSEAETQGSRELYIKYILDRQLQDGGWSLSGQADAEADPDITGMALAALAKYQDRDDVKNAVARALERLSAMQNEKGGFSSWGSENSESAVQVMVALCELGVALDDERFVKNGKTVFDNVLSFYKEDGGFLHTRDGGGSNQMATEQCFYGIVAAKRATDGRSSLYRISDNITVKAESGNSFGLPDKNEAVSYKEITFAGRTFSDITGHLNRPAIEALASRGIISGKTKDTFEPDATMTRAEFAAIIVNGLGLPVQYENHFADISQNDWFFDYINTAYFYGIVSGVSDSEFNPAGTITREEAAAMTARAAALCGMKTDMQDFAARDILAGFTDYVKVSDWAVNALAFCYEAGILDDSEIEIGSKIPVTRAEIAQMLFNLLGKAELL